MATDELPERAPLTPVIAEHERFVAYLADGLRVLSMLKLDAETRNIPVVTYTSASDEEREDDEEYEEPAPMFVTRPAPLMN